MNLRTSDCPWWSRRNHEGGSTRSCRRAVVASFARVPQCRRPVPGGTRLRPRRRVPCIAWVASARSATLPLRADAVGRRTDNHRVRSRRSLPGRSWPCDARGWLRIAGAGLRPDPRQGQGALRNFRRSPRRSYRSRFGSADPGRREVGAPTVAGPNPDPGSALRPLFETDPRSSEGDGAPVYWGKHGPSQSQRNGRRCGLLPTRLWGPRRGLVERREIPTLLGSYPLATAGSSAPSGKFREILMRVGRVCDERQTVLGALRYDLAASAHNLAALSRDPRVDNHRGGSSVVLGLLTNGSDIHRGLDQYLAVN